MPKVRMLVRVSGTRDGKEWPDIGETLDVSQDEADQLLLNGSAAKASDKDVETALKPQEEEVAVIRTAPAKVEKAKSQREAVKDAPKPATQATPGTVGLTTGEIDGGKK